MHDDGLPFALPAGASLLLVEASSRDMQSRLARTHLKHVGRERSHLIRLDLQVAQPWLESMPAVQDVDRQLVNQYVRKTE
jgi:hypothetical protein